jgi:dihydropyrimidinase
LAEHDRRRAPDLEAATVALAAAAARAVRARLYVAHLSSELAVDAVRRARALGSSIRGESCAHYMTLDSGAPLGSLGRVAPPLRPAASVAAMRRLATDPDSGIDVVASDHCGYSAEEKPLEDFAHAGNGLPGLDSLVPLLLDGVLGDGWLTPADVVRLTARGPAETFGLVGKGRIEPGADADLVVVDPAGTTELTTSPPGPSTARSPYGRRRLRGAVTHVLRRGVLLVSGSELTEAARQGGGVAVVRKEPAW